MQKLRDYFRLFLAVCTAVVVSGCAQRVSFSAAKRAAVRNADVARQSAYPDREHVIIYTLGQNLAVALGGVIGSAAAVSAAGDDRTQFSAFLKSQQIDAGLIMAEAFDRELKNSRLWPVSEGPADATFRFDVKVVGLMIPNGFTGRLSPYLAVEGKLVRRDGSVLWQRTDFIRDADVRCGLEEYLQRPDVLRAALETAARKLSQQFIESIREESAD